MTRISQYLDDLQLQNAPLGEIVAQLRTRALAAGPAVREEFKYGGILFSAAAPFCGVFAYRAHVSLEFSQGSALADPFGLLAGKGKLRRHIQLTPEAEILWPQIEHYLAAACHAAEANALP